jgi:drug/metabolite transporter (DMT)-like permease
MIMPGSFKDRYLPDLSLLSVTVVWGLSFTVLKSILGNEVSPLLFVFGRFALAVIVMLPFCLTNVSRLDRKGLFGGIFLGVLIFAGFTTQTIGIGFTSASKSAFITGLSVIFVPIFLLIHRGILPRPVFSMAIMAAVAGMYLLTGPAGGGFNRGDFLTLLCAIAFGAQIYVMGLVAPGRDFRAVTFVELLTTALLAAMFLPLEEIRFHFSAVSVTAMIFLGLAATAGALVIQTWAQRRTSAVKAGLIFSAEPVFAYMFASVLLDEFFNPIQKLGGAVIIVAVLSTEVLPSVLGRGKAGRFSERETERE